MHADRRTQTDSPTQRQTHANKLLLIDKLMCRDRQAYRSGRYTHAWGQKGMLAHVERQTQVDRNTDKGMKIDRQPDVRRKADRQTGQVLKADRHAHYM